MWRRLACIAVSFVAFSCTRNSTESPTRGRLRVVAAESHAPLAARQAELFNGLYSEARVDVRAATTREAYVALLNDSVSCILVDRPPNAEERRAISQLHLAVEEMRVAEDALALLVHPSNPLESVTLGQVADLLCGHTQNWHDLPGSGVSGPVTLIATGRNSGTWELLAERFFPGARLLAPAILATGQQDVMAHVAHDPNALGIVSVATWKARASDASATAASAAAPGWASGVAKEASTAPRALAIAGTDSLGHPTRGALHQANIHSGAYPLHYPVYLLFDRDSMLAAGFCAFVASAPGQKLILDAGLVPARMPVRLVQLQ